MIKKMIVVALFLAVVPMEGYSADTDKTAPPPGESASSPSPGTSYFQGVWVGSWPGFTDAGISQGISIKVGKEIKDKIFNVTYSYDAVETRRGITPAGKVKTEGKEQEDKLFIQGETKHGRKFEITLEKYKNDVVKARIEKLGPTSPKERASNETYLNRK
jgi:hypothetical protein